MFFKEAKTDATKSAKEEKASEVTGKKLMKDLKTNEEVLMGELGNITKEEEVGEEEIDKFLNKVKSLGDIEIEDEESLLSLEESITEKLDDKVENEVDEFESKLIEEIEDDISLHIDDEEEETVAFDEYTTENKEDTMSKEQVIELDFEDKVGNKVGESNIVEEVTLIGRGTKINGNVSSEGSVEVFGVVEGDIDCLGKLTINGVVKGNSSANDVVINAKRLEGNVTSDGSVKVGQGTVIIGDISASNSAISGAVKGQIDVNGSVTLDSTAIVKGNIKAKSVQINNGAVVDGYCSLVYASVDIENVFDEE